MTHDITPSHFIDDLPVFAFRSIITKVVDDNQVTIVTAETGAGKSTQIPQYLADHGYTKVIVTQPRILAARNLSKRVREEWALRTTSDSEPIIGYRTSQERDDDPHNQILYCTDGLQLVREITGFGITEKQVLILDEVHEWNENMEVLIAWAKKRCQEDPRFKVVVMSATIDTAPLAEYFETTAVITIPGRSYEVTKRKGEDLINEIFKKIEQGGSNVLVFLPGKSEIQNVSDVITPKALAAGIPIITLHSQLEATAQQAAFANYPSGKIILATNIAQTSVTIDDIDVVIDSGLERRSEVRSGVEGLFIAQTSQADCLQRAGRAGRTKAGEYILAQYDTLPCVTFEERPEYGTPEILRKHIDRLTLRLANVGIDIELLDFFHDPSTRAITQAKRTLVALGALTPTGNVTNIGRSMERYPVESSYARMLVESQEYEPEVQTKLAAIIAIQEIGGIVKGGPRYVGWKKYTKQSKSDLLAQYDVFRALDTINPDEYEEIGIISKNVSKARDVMQRLNHDLSGIDLDEQSLTGITESEQDSLMYCIVAGQIDQLWSVSPDGNATHITTKDVRELSSTTVVKNPTLIAGTPFDLEVPTRDGTLQTLHLVQAATAVKSEWLVALDPEKFSASKGKSVFEPRLGMLVSKQIVRAGKKILEGMSIPVTEKTRQYERFFQEELSKWIYMQLDSEKRMLQTSHSKRIPTIPYHYVQAHVYELTRGVIMIDELSTENKKALFNLAKLETHVGTQFMHALAESYKQRRTPGRHHTHRGFKPGHKQRKKHDHHDNYY